MTRLFLTSMDQNQYLVALFIIIALWSSQAMSRTLLQDEVSLSERHEQWMSKHGKVYKDAAEKEKRYQIFKDNLAYIESFNMAGNKSYKLKINHLADQTNEEFKASSTGLNRLYGQMKNTGITFKYENVTDIPATMDWRKRGAVTRVKNQRHCGSCWAFSTVAAIESMFKIAGGKLVSLSEQQLVDCNTNGVSNGCSGGNMEDGFEFIIAKGGIASQENYPYKGVDGTCDKKASHIVEIPVHSYGRVPSNSEKALLKAVANQPVSVSIAVGRNFQFYSSGIFSGECGTRNNHEVTIVGFGINKDGTKYWLAKNSWGKRWGEKGYIRMQRDIDAEEGLCGIATDASFPNIYQEYIPNKGGLPFIASTTNWFMEIVTESFFNSPKSI
ncbi:ervatamin-B-like [Lotus japonicus]|uniref:ervatamin-B-like n=1 Tax=Lotus japonicus TaxID=34305 RepID=UPI00258489CD|nr:ervatamin-B-like [Lotus japonicus]